jgi:ABC-type branched-subunit amino acid transport system permease subunit
VIEIAANISQKYVVSVTWLAGLPESLPFVVLSLGLLVKTSGQVSLCHAAFAAIGAVAFSQLTVGAGIPWFAALILAGLIVVPVGAFVAIPAIRLRGIFLALATFGFGIFVEQMLYPLSWMFTTLSSGRAVPRPSFGSSDTGFYYIVLLIVVLTALIMVAIHQGRLGRVLCGLSDSPLAVATMGLSTNTTRVIVFCISAFFAAISGILYAASIHFAVSGDVHFQSFYSLTLLALLALAPFAEPW